MTDELAPSAFQLWRILPLPYLVSIERGGQGLAAEEDRPDPLVAESPLID